MSAVTAATAIAPTSGCYIQGLFSVLYCIILSYLLLSFRVIQVTNVAPQASKEQMQTLFGFIGKLEDLKLYPTM